MEKIDLKKLYKHLYSPPSNEVTLVEVPEFQFLMIDGHIEPGSAPAESQSFQDALGALYSVAYTLKFMSKLDQENPLDFTVMALEALWWVQSGSFNLSEVEPWYFTAMMMQPDHITSRRFQEALAQASKKRPNPALSHLRFEPFREGLSIQMMHIGPYADEKRTLEQMRAFALEHGYDYRGKHHEIYLGDPRRAAPEKLKTVLRQPVQEIL